MADMCLLETDHERAKFRQAQPVRHLPPQHAALLLTSTDLALAGDDKHEGRAIGVRALEEGEQRAMRGSTFTA